MRRRPIPGSSGQVRPLSLYGAPVLTTPARETGDFGPWLEKLVEDLFATMYAARGVGLAAPQIGEDVRVFVYDCPDDEDRRHLGHLVNPRLVEVDGPVVRGPEGCLSLPGLEAGTPRFDRAVVEGRTADGARRRVEGTGFFARCLQHEYDHLEGGLYVDRLDARRHRKVLREAGRTGWGKAAGL